MSSSPQREDVCAEVAVSIFSPSLSPPPSFYLPPFYVTHHLQLAFLALPFFLSIFVSLPLFILSPRPLFFSSLFLFWCCREEMPFQRNEVFRGSKVISLVQSKLSDFREPWRRNLPHRLPPLRSNPFTFPSSSPLSISDGGIRNVTKITLYLEIRGRSGHLKNGLV